MENLVCRVEKRSPPSHGEQGAPDLLALASRHGCAAARVRPIASRRQPLRRIAGKHPAVPVPPASSRSFTAILDSRNIPGEPETPKPAPAAAMAAARRGAAARGTS